MMSVDLASIRGVTKADRVVGQRKIAKDIDKTEKSKKAACQR